MSEEEVEEGGDEETKKSFGIWVRVRISIGIGIQCQTPKSGTSIQVAVYRIWA